jgi:ParB-like chromosome segregation protein Spo0J
MTLGPQFDEVRGITNDDVIKAHPGDDGVPSIVRNIRARSWDLKHLPTEKVYPSLSIDQYRQWDAEEGTDDTQRINNMIDTLRSGGALPPIIMGEDDLETIEDGHHRLVAHREAKMPTIRAFIPRM